MTWKEWVILAILLIVIPVGQGFFGEMQRRRARRKHRVAVTPEERQQAFYQTWKPAIAKSKGPQEFYDVEKEGL